MNKSQLSRPQRRVIEQCQQVNFGRITLHVRNGEPDRAQPWRTRRTVKLAGGENGSRPEAGLADFELCQKQMALLNTLSQTPDGTCVTIEVRHGLPLILEIEQDYQAA